MPRTQKYHVDKFTSASDLQEKLNSIEELCWESNVMQVLSHGVYGTSVYTLIWREFAPRNPDNDGVTGTL